MDNVQIFSKILKKFEDFSIEKIEESSVIFKYLENIHFTIWFLDDNYDFNDRMPIVVVNNFNSDFPHILTESISIGEVEYRAICLYEKEKFIFSELNDNQKFTFLIDCLLNLLNLTQIEKEKEFQKEFLHYWNNAATIPFKPHTYFNCNSRLYKLDYYLKGSKYRVLTNDKILNDIEKWKKTKNVGFLIPITNKRNIIPPTKASPWTVENILDILRNPQISKIASEVYEELSQTVIRNKKIDLFFLFPVEDDRNLIFGCRITFKNSGSRRLFDKLLNDVERVDPFSSFREDFDYLNQAIGNSTIKKKIAIIGCGSLGSYVASEVIKSGANNLLLVDEDFFFNENTFRHVLPHYMKGINKATALKYTLQSIHPEIFVKSIPEKLKKENIDSVILNNNVDVLIFCIGSTDEQKKLSKILTSNKVNCATLYCWLEVDGENSRIIGIPKKSRGCFYCLKKEVEKFFLRKSEPIKEEWISDGCGGTRVKYGNRTLLSAANGVIESLIQVQTLSTPFVISSNIVKGLSKKELDVCECEFCGK